MNIAIVDDDFEFHKTLRAILAGHSFFGTIKDYYSGHDFLCACDAGSFDVVFLDVEMPGADGLNVAEQMRRKAMKSIVVFVTNHSETVFQAFGLNVNNNFPNFLLSLLRLLIIHLIYLYAIIINMLLY